MKEYHLVVTPDAFQSSLEVDSAVKLEAIGSYGPEDKVKESYVLHMEYNYGVRSSTIRSKSGRDKFVSLIHEPLRKVGQTPTGRCNAEFSGAIAVRYGG